MLRRGLFGRERWRRALAAERSHPGRVPERIFDDSGASALDSLAQDLRFAARALHTRPAFTAVAVLTLAIGIGANVAIFSAVDAMLLRRLPFREPERLMTVSLSSPPRPQAPARDDMGWSLPKFAVFRDAQTVFTDLTLYGSWQATVLGGDGAERVRAEVTDARYLPTLDIRPAIGRNFGADEDRVVGGPKVVLLGDALWRRRFAGDPGVVGRTIGLGGDRYTIIGVMPPGFRGLTGRAELWTTIVAGEPTMAGEPWVDGFTLVARLKAGISPALAVGEVRQLGRRVDEAYPPHVPGEHWGATARELDAGRVDPMVRHALLMLLGGVGLVLLIACANVANLLLVRAAGRQREISVRVALGAGRGRLVRQLLTESVLLSTLGGVVGVAVAWWGVRLLVALDPTQVLRIRTFAQLGVVSFDQIRLDGPALAFAAAVTLGTCVLFGLAPALQATGPARGAGLRQRRTVRGGALLATAQVALAVVLLVGAGLMLRSLGNLFAVRQGFEPEGVLTVGLGRPDALDDALFPGYHDGKGEALLPRYYGQVLARVAALPGVTGVALQDCPPLSGGCGSTPIELLDRPPLPPGQQPAVGVHWITPSWPAVVRVPLLRGRAFTDGDRAGAPEVVLVGQTAARRLWPGQDPIGKPVNMGIGAFGLDTAHVVGVLGDVRYGAPDSLPKSDVYLPYDQAPDVRVTMLVRTAGDPLALVATVRRVIHDVAPNAPVFDARPLVGRVRDALAFARFGTLLLASFAAVALALATLGVYGVLAFAVAQRTREIGVRVALGAMPGDVVRLVVGRGLAIAVAGGAAGIAGAIAATRVLRSLLYDVAPSDPATYTVIVALLVAAVVAASWLPARRAAGVAPTEALRVE